MVIHLFDSSKVCYQRLISRNQVPKSNPASKPINLSEILLDRKGMEVESSLNCYQCGIEFQNQVAYLLHLDHHQLISGHQIECKACKQTFNSSCTFHKHNCKIGVGGKTFSMGCLICIKLNPVYQMEFNGSLKHQAVDIEIKEELIEEKDKTCNESIGKLLLMTLLSSHIL